MDKYLLTVTVRADGSSKFAKGDVYKRQVYHVTTLEDNPTNPQKGSFRWALTQKGARTIVFDVAGTIKLKAQLRCV